MNLYSSQNYKKINKWNQYSIIFLIGFRRANIFAKGTSYRSNFFTELILHHFTVSHLIINFLPTTSFCQKLAIFWSPHLQNICWNCRCLVIVPTGVVFSTIIYYGSTILSYCGNWWIPRRHQSLAQLGLWNCRIGYFRKGLTTFKYGCKILL